MRKSKRKVLWKERRGVGKLTGRGLEIASLAIWARDLSTRVKVSGAVRERLRKGRKVIERILRSGQRVYGINTGFGRFAQVAIQPDEVEALQRNLLVSHAVAVGPEFSAAEVRAIFLLRIQGLLQGHSGVREELVDFLVRVFNAGIVPCVPEQGSCGASGDLAPLAHLALVLIGNGSARVVKGERLSEPMPGVAALRKGGLKPIPLKAKEGLTLINGTQVMTAIGALACHRLATLLESADVIGAMTLEALKGSRTPFRACIQEVRAHPGQRQVAQHLTQLLRGSEILQSHRHCDKIQDAYSLRCMPQVHGATRDALAFCQEVIGREMNAVTDNPLVFPENEIGEQVLSGGNFHGQVVAQALDFLGISATDLASISERRIERLLNPDLSGLPAFLAYQGGLHSGFMMAQVTAASLVSESKVLAHPASVDSIPTSANQEDHVSMGTTSARKLRTIVENVSHVLAIELLCAAQAIEHHRPLKSSHAIEEVLREFRRSVSRLRVDREMGRDLRQAQEFITSGRLLAATRGRQPRRMKKEASEQPHRHT